MAGGRGLRLHPLTIHSPKSMLEVGKKPMLETLIHGFADQGFDKFTLCVHYKAELIEGYFRDGSSMGVNIEYVREPYPMGTAGALGLMPRPERPFIVINADVLTRLDYVGLLAFHESCGTLATVCLALHQYQIPYGVPKLEGDRIVEIAEKPILNTAVSAGIYVLSPEALDEIPEGPSDMPDLLQSLMKKSNGTTAVTSYCLTEYWMDVGTFSDLTKAREIHEAN